MNIMRTKKILPAGIIYFVIHCFVLGCAAGPQVTEPQPDIAEDQVLRVGVRANSPPLIFKQNGRITGLEADLAVALAAYMAKTVHFVELQWEELIPALLDKRIDIIMSGMSVTQARKVRIAFAKPYLKAGQMALVPGEDKNKYWNVYSVKTCNLKVAVEKGTTGDFLVQQEFINAQIAPFDSPEKAAKALLEGRIKMFVHDAPVIWWLASVNEAKGVTAVPIFLTQEDIAWGIRYNDSDMLTAANSFLSEWKNNGLREKSITKWVPYAR